MLASFHHFLICIFFSFCYQISGSIRGIIYRVSLDFSWETQTSFHLQLNNPTNMYDDFLHIRLKAKLIWTLFESKVTGSCFVVNSS